MVKINIYSLRSDHQGCAIKRVFLKISQNAKENTHALKENLKEVFSFLLYRTLPLLMNICIYVICIYVCTYVIMNICIYVICIYVYIYILYIYIYLSNSSLPKLGTCWEEKLALIQAILFYKFFCAVQECLRIALELRYI